MDHDLDALIAARLKALRQGRAMTLDVLAERSGVSRAMISRIERGEANPTAVLLARLAAALGTALADLFSTDAAQSPLVRAGERPFWRDPETGYLRRPVSPRGQSGLDIVEVELPAGASLHYDNLVPNAIEQYVWLLEGALEVGVGASTHTLGAGDCLLMRLDAPIRFHNPGLSAARYAVVLVPLMRGHP